MLRKRPLAASNFVLCSILVHCCKSNDDIRYELISIYSFSPNPLFGDDIISDDKNDDTSFWDDIRYVSLCSLPIPFLFS